MNSVRRIQIAKVIRATDLGATVQLLCADDGGLSSVYLEHKPFSLFYEAIHKAGLELNGLQIQYDRDRVHVPSLDKTWGSHAIL